MRRRGARLQARVASRGPRRLRRPAVDSSGTRRMRQRRSSCSSPQTRATQTARMNPQTMTRPTHADVRAEPGGVLKEPVEPVTYLLQHGIAARWAARDCENRGPQAPAAWCCGPESVRARTTGVASAWARSAARRFSASCNSWLVVGWAVCASAGSEPVCAGLSDYPQADRAPPPLKRAPATIRSVRGGGRGRGSSRGARDRPVPRAGDRNSSDLALLRRPPPAWSGPSGACDNQPARRRASGSKCESLERKEAGSLRARANWPKTRQYSRPGRLRKNSETPTL